MGTHLCYTTNKLSTTHVLVCSHSFRFLVSSHASTYALTQYTHTLTKDTHTHFHTHTRTAHTCHNLSKILSRPPEKKMNQFDRINVMPLPLSLLSRSPSHPLSLPPSLSPSLSLHQASHFFVFPISSCFLASQVRPKFLIILIDFRFHI